MLYRTAYQAPPRWPLRKLRVNIVLRGVHLITPPAVLRVRKENVPRENRHLVGRQDGKFRVWGEYSYSLHGDEYFYEEDGEKG